MTVPAVVPVVAPVVVPPVVLPAVSSGVDEHAASSNPAASTVKTLNRI
jgi:hypothetical protein